MSSPRFRFCQVELPWALGPADGRYVVRVHAGEPSHVLVLRTLGAPERRRLRRRRGGRGAPAEPAPAPVTTTRATVIFAERLDEPTVRRWLDGADLEAELAAGLAVLNDALDAQRIAAADPFVRAVSLDQALVARVGYGAGDEVADGRWSAARELSAPARRRTRPSRAGALRPQERLSALLGGRDVALAAEELTLRARHDLDRGRGREAALQVRVALEAALAELPVWGHRPEVAKRLGALADEREAVAAAAHRALEGGLDDAQLADVERVVARLEAALAARVAGGLE